MNILRTMTAQQVERMLYLELVADLYNEIDAIKDPEICAPQLVTQAQRIQRLEMILSQMGIMRPTASKIMPRRRRI